MHFTKYDIGYHSCYHIISYIKSSYHLRHTDFTQAQRTFVLTQPAWCGPTNGLLILVGSRQHLKKKEAGSAKWFFTVPPPISNVRCRVDSSRRWFAHLNWQVLFDVHGEKTLPILCRWCPPIADVGKTERAVWVRLFWIEASADWLNYQMRGGKENV